MRYGALRSGAVFPSTVTKASGSHGNTGISSNVDVCELANHHTNSSGKVYKFIYSSQHSLAYCTADSVDMITKTM